MLRNSVTVFKEFIPAATYAAPVFTSTRFNELLGRFDQLVLQAVVEQCIGTGGPTAIFDALVEHSGNGLAWIMKVPQAPPPVGEIHMTNLTAAGPNLGQAWTPSDADPTPMLACVRLRLYFTGPITGGRVTIYAAQRDQGG